MIQIQSFLTTRPGIYVMPFIIVLLLILILKSLMVERFTPLRFTKNICPTSGPVEIPVKSLTEESLNNYK